MPTLEELWIAATPPAVSRHLEYPTGSMIDEFDRFTAEFAELPALDFFARETSYRELREAVYTVAGNLAELGVGPGKQVALLMPNCPQHDRVLRGAGGGRHGGGAQPPGHRCRAASPRSC